jgi:hypothetical protein
VKSLVVVVTTDGSEYQYLRDLAVEPFSVITTKSSRNSKSGFSKRDNAARNSFKSYIAKSFSKVSFTVACATIFF